MKIKNKSLEEVKAAIRDGCDFDEKMLFRLVGDCKYYLGHGNKDKNVLWAKNIADQIFEMRRLYYSLVVKPNDVTDEDIRLFSLAMVYPEKVTYLHVGARTDVWDHLPTEFVGKDGETDIWAYIGKQWFIERWELDDGPVWLIWIGGEIVDYFVNEDLVNEILETNARDIAN